MVNWQALSSHELVSLFPCPVIILDGDGVIVEANACAHELFERTTFGGLNIEALLTQPERARLNPLAWLRKWADSPDAPELSYVYLTSVTASGAEKSLSVRVARVGDNPAHYLVTIHDMSPWQARFVRERESHQLAARLLSITADGVILTDAQQLITFANSSAEQLFECSQGELLGLPLNDLIPVRFRRIHAEHVGRFAHARKSSRLMGDRQPVTARTRTGIEISIEASISRLTQQGAVVFCALLRQRKNAV